MNVKIIIASIFAGAIVACDLINHASYVLAVYLSH